MRIKRIVKITVCMLALASLISVSVLAVTESEVQEEVNRIGTEGVTGNILVWFLCAVAFLKVSQKIDSFMSSLGVSVGHTGGSMLAELLVTARSVGAVHSIAGGRGLSFGRGSGGSSGEGSLVHGGLAGMASRGITGDAVKNANGTKSGGLGGAVFNSSVAKGGTFANRVIGSIANGSIKETGTISGNGATDALMSYMGYTALGENADNIPSFSDVEIGGGKITGKEVSAEYPDGIAFAMYSSEKYSAPEDNYTTVTAADGTSWYKQYAAVTVVQHPFTHPDGYIDRGEKIEKRLPKAPQRKDRQ